MWTEANATPPKLIVNHAIAVLAEVRETDVQPHDEDKEWEKDEQRKRLMPHQEGEGEESTENETCSDREAAMPQTLLVSRRSRPYPNPTADTECKPRYHENRKVWCHGVARHTPNEKEISHGRVSWQTR